MDETAPFSLNDLESTSESKKTYAERLGWPKESKVVIFHVDDAGMSHESNEGAMEAIDFGLANSTSIMMPCSWSPEFLSYLRKKPKIDAGIHLTLTSEWDTYRWRPILGKNAVPGLCDEHGFLWHTVADVLSHATVDEVDREIQAQFEQAIFMGFNPTHIDTHMFTLFANEKFLEVYIKLGIEKKIPIMFPGGDNVFYLSERNANSLIDMQNGINSLVDPIIPNSESLIYFKKIGRLLWENGLPVLDDLHNSSYGWKMPDIRSKTDIEIQAWYTDKYIQSLDKLSAGLTMVILHCTKHSDTFDFISDSGYKRKGELLAMIDPRLKAYMMKNNIILTTWREVTERRNKLMSDQY